MDTDVSWDWSEYVHSLGLREVGTPEVIQDGRNEIARVRTDSGRELVLKRGMKRLPNGDGSLLSEGLAYLALREVSLSHIATRCILHDRKNDVLLLDYIDGPTLRESWIEVGERPTFWASIGVLLAELHTRSRLYPEWTNRLLGGFEHLIPSADSIGPSDLVSSTHAELQLLATIQLDESVRTRLGEMRQPIRPSLIHGDARIDNIMVDAHGALKLIDLELCRVGDPLFDLGTLVGSVIEQESAAVPIDENERASAYSSRLLDSSAVRIRFIIAGYRAAIRQSTEGAQGSEEFLSRLSSYIGIHLLHRAGAIAGQFHAETRVGRVWAIIGCSFLKNPSLLLRPLGLDASHSWIHSRDRIAS